jgi:hypothetical protein
MDWEFGRDSAGYPGSDLILTRADPPRNVVGNALVFDVHVDHQIIDVQRRGFPAQCR